MKYEANILGMRYETQFLGSNSSVKDLKKKKLLREGITCKIQWRYTSAVVNTLNNLGSTADKAFVI